MNEYLKAFQSIAQSVDQLLNNEHHSLEIKQSATNLKKSVQPCVEELQQSAIKLNKLILVCSDELYHTESVWFSKPKIVRAAKHKIWEHLGELSGHSVKVRQIGNQFKNEAVKQARQSWNKWMEYLIEKWFVDENGYKKGIGWNEKAGFINEVKIKIDYQYREIDQLIKEKLYLVVRETQATHLESIYYCTNRLAPKIKAELNNQIALTNTEIKTKFTNHTEHLPEGLLELKTTVGLNLKALTDQGWSDIQRKDVIKFKDKVSAEIDKFITAIFTDRVELVIKANAQVIKFYNDFLEQQERYQQETPEQRKAEKAWLDQQRQELALLQDGIQAILNNAILSAK